MVPFLNEVLSLNAQESLDLIDTATGNSCPQ